MVAARNIVASVLLAAGSSHAFLGGGMPDMATLMKLSAMRRQFNVDSLAQDQSVALMEYAGFNDMELFMSKQISADEFKTSMKQQMKDNLIQSVLTNGGIDLTNPFFRKQFFDDIDNAESFTIGMPEPMQSIIRLMKHKTDADVRAYGKQLLKKMQFEKFNTGNGNVITDNIDEILLAKDKGAVIKEILQQSMYTNIQDPLDRAMWYYVQAQRTDPSKKATYKQQIKDLQTIKIFQGSVPDSSPVTDDNLFAFYRMVNGKVAAEDVLNIALGENLGPISELDFERYFGSPAKQFSCRAHNDVLRVPCGIKLKPDECVAAGCCYNPSSVANVPQCYHDLYGKIGSGLLRRAYVKGNPDATKQIESLFVDKTIPTLDKILREELPFGLTTNKYNTGTKKYTNDGPMNAVEYKNKNWWDVSKVTDFQAGPNEKQANYEPLRETYMPFQEAERPRYGRPGYQWKPHGPTQSPFFENLPGVNPTANPLNSGLGTLDDYYKIWLEYAATQDMAQCALIPDASRVKCMENYEALVDAVLLKKGTGKNYCINAGCCFNEDSFLRGLPACYRATNYGQCRNLPANFQKKECGYDGITENECLNNVKCCYEPSADRKDPWCYFKYSATLDENQWCAAWSEPQFRTITREPCFAKTVAKANSIFNDDEAHNINNLIGREQCERSDCCYDDSLSTEYIDWLTEGLGYGTQYRCFKKRNPMVVAQERAITGGAAAGTHGNSKVSSGLPGVANLENEKVDRNKNTPGGTDKLNPHTYTPRIKTCDNTNWQFFGAGKIGTKRSCGENLSYYQCVYVQRCCYKPTVTNEPVCYHPEFKANTGYPAAIASKP